MWEWGDLYLERAAGVVIRRGGGERGDAHVKVWAVGGVVERGCCLWRWR